MNCFRKYCKNVHETREIENIPVNELNPILAKFAIEVRRTDGKEFEPDTLSAYKRGIQRYTDEKNKKINILKDAEFNRSKNALGAKRKDLTRKGHGSRHNATRQLRPEGN